MPCVLLIVERNMQPVVTAETWVAGEICAVVQHPHNWSALELDTSYFLRFVVTDKTPQEMSAYLQQYRRIYDLRVIAGPNPEGLRRIEVVNEMVNNSESRGVWTQELVNQILTEWNGRYPESNLIDLGFTARKWTCEGKFTTGQAEEFERVITEKGFEAMDKRKQWYITPAGMDNIRAAGGEQSGTGQQLGQILRDGTLD